MDPTTILAAISVIGNLLLGLFGVWERAKKRKAEEQTATIAEGLKIVEQAIEAAKKIQGAGKVVTSQIVAQGPEAAMTVDDARLIAKNPSL